MKVNKKIEKLIKEAKNEAEKKEYEYQKKLRSLEDFHEVHIK